MSLLIEAYDLVKAHTNWVSKIFLNAIDTDQLNKNETLILIRNSSGLPASYGSNEFHIYQGNIQVQIFLGLNVSFDLEEKMMGLMHEFNLAHWQIIEVKPTIPDPDTKQLTATIIISKSKEAF